MLSLICGIQNMTNEPIFAIETYVENRLVIAKGGADWQKDERS